MRYLNLVHLSDLHLRAEGTAKFNQAQILKGLMADLQASVGTAFAADAIIFSGDLSNTGDEKNYGDIGKLIAQIAESASLTLDRVFLCPGNHDAQRSVIIGSADICKSRRQIPSGADKLNSLFFDQAFVSYAGRVFRNYQNGMHGVGPKASINNAFATLSTIDALNLSVISINTALLTAGGLDGFDPDDGRLLYPEIALVDCLESANADHLKVVVGHHPLEMLREDCRELIQRALLQRADLYMFGHMHRASPLVLQSPVGECAMMQSGALYASREWWNGYALISAVPGSPHLRVRLRKWHEERNAFGVASELDDEGVVYCSEAARRYWKSIRPRLDRHKLDTWRKEYLLPKLESDCAQTLAHLALEHVYVQPQFVREAYVETAEGKQLQGQPRTQSYRDVWGSAENYIISAEAESGKTTLLRKWSLDSARMPATDPQWRLPILVNFDDITKTKYDGFAKSVRRKVQDLPPGIDAEMLLLDGAVTLLIDDFALEDSEAKKAISDFATKYPKCRYVFITSTPFLMGAGIAPVISPGVNFTTLRVRKLVNSQLLELIQKHGVSPTDADRLLQRLLTEATDLSLPLTPVSSTFFIQIYTERDKRPLINRANLVERYVEISLEKFAAEELLDGYFDFGNKADLLSDLAERMCREDTYRVDEGTIVSWFKSYLDVYGLRASPINLLKYFVDARILERSEGLVLFRLRAFLEYFAARRMDVEPGFREFICAPDRYLSFKNEIVFYSAISRRDDKLLDEMFSRFRANSGDVWKDTPIEVRDGSLLETFNVPAPDATEQEVLAIERSVFETGLTEQSRRELLDADATVPETDNKNVVRTLYSDAADKWLGQLQLVSAMLKHSEFIPDARKRELLSETIHGWIRFACLSLGLVPGLAKEKTTKIMGVRYVIQFPDHMTVAQIARRIFVYLPIAVVRMANQYLGTDKLQVQFEAGLGNSKELNASQQFFRVGLLSLQGTQGISKQLSLVSEALKQNIYLREVLLRQMYELAIRYRLPENEIDPLRKLAAEIGASLEGASGRKLARRKTQIANSLKSAGHRRRP